MKKKFVNAFIIIAILTTIVACTSKEKTPIYDSSEGCYYAQGILEEVSIKFDLKDKTFIMNFGVTSSMIVKGNIEIEENKIIAISESGSAKYIFDIVDKESISFVKKESTENILWEDGTKFVVLRTGL